MPSWYNAYYMNTGKTLLSIVILRPWKKVPGMVWMMILEVLPFFCTVIFSLTYANHPETLVATRG
jgi:hypothetical protein